MTPRQHRRTLPLAFLRRWEIACERRLRAQIAALDRRRSREIARTAGDQPHDHKP